MSGFWSTSSRACILVDLQYTKPHVGELDQPMRYFHKCTIIRYSETEEAGKYITIMNMSTQCFMIMHFNNIMHIKQRKK
jgi:hypothetical protein